MRRERWAAWFPPDDPHLQRYLRAVGIGSAGSLVVYLSILWSFRIAPFRQALGRGDLANFYDFQARALLHGHLNVPRGSLGIEGFIEHGREYMYFPPGPAIARMPLLALTDRFDGRLTAVSMLLAWFATTALFAALIWRVRRVLRGKAPLPMWEAIAYALLIVAGMAGSVLVYLAAMPWVYHEAYAWSIAAAMAGAFTLLGVIQLPTRGRVYAVGGAVLCGVLVRATTGWAMGFATIATGIWFLTGRHSPRGKPLGRLLLAVAVVPLLVGVGFNWAKFQHPYLFRLDDQVWTSVNEHRREALEANGPDLAGVNLLPSTLATYFRPDGIRFIPVPPFVTFPNDPAKPVAGAFLDQTYRTGSAVPFMPVLVLLGIWGLVTTFRPGGPSRAKYLRIPVLASGAICGAMLIYGYIAYRYLGEMLPVLLVAAAIGLVDLGHLLSLRSAAQRTWFLRGLGALTALGVVANGAVSITAQALSNPGPMLDRYLAVQERVSSLTPGDPLSGLVSRGDHLPARGPGEHLFILGDCDALYVSQAETYWPWVAAEARPLQFDVAYDPPRTTPNSTVVEVELAHVLDRGGALDIDVRGDGAFRMSFDSPTGGEETGWFPMGGSTVVIDVVPKVDTYTVLADGAELLSVPMSDFDEDWYRFQNLLQPTPIERSDTEAGVIMRSVAQPAPARCERLLRSIGG